MESGNKYPFIIFDGECNFCNYFVQFVLEREKSQKFNFTPLDSNTARNFFIEHNIKQKDQEAIWLVLDDSTFYKKSSATLRIMKNLKSPWSLSVVFLVVPPFLRNLVYDFISKRRKRILKNKTCPVFSEETQKRFLD